MRHSRVRAELGPYLEGELSSSQRARIAAHLERCAACREVLAELRRTVALLRELPDPEPPSGLAGSVMERVREREARRALSWRRLAPVRSPRGIAAAGAVAAVAALVWLWAGPPGLRGGDPSQGPAGVESPVLPSPDVLRRSLEGSASGARFGTNVPEEPAVPRRVPPPERELSPSLAGALQDPHALVRRLLSPEPGRPTLEELASEARRAGVAPRLAHAIRKTRAPGAESVAVRFERVAQLPGSRR